MRGQRLQQANKFAKKLWWKHHRDSIQLEKCFRGDVDLSKFPPIGVYRKTKVFCSSPFCCGNPRRQRGVRRGGLTLQELRRLKEDE